MSEWMNECECLHKERWIWILWEFKIHLTHQATFRNNARILEIILEIIEINANMYILYYNFYVLYIKMYI